MMDLKYTVDFRKFGKRDCLSCGHWVPRFAQRLNPDLAVAAMSSRRSTVFSSIVPWSRLPTRLPYPGVPIRAKGFLPLAVVPQLA